MNKIDRMVRTIFLTYGETWKIPIDEEEILGECYDYEESYIVQKRMRHKELREHIMEKGYTREQAEEVILNCWVRGVIDLVSADLDSKSRDKNEYVVANEEYWVEKESERLGHWVVDILMGSNIREYVTEYSFFADGDEEKLREVYAEQNRKELSKKSLVSGLVEKGYTKKNAEGLIEKYTTIEIREEVKKNWNTAEKLFRRPEYKPLKHHENKRIVKLKNRDKNILEVTNEGIIVIDIPDCYEIMQIEEWLLREYEELSLLRRHREYIFGTEKVSFRTIRKILWEAETQGKNLTHNEFKQRIIEECGVTEGEAEMAIYGALRTFKIRSATPPRETWNQKPVRKKEYYWSGTSCKYPPLTLQDKALNPIKKVFTEAEKQGKTTLTHKELVEKALQAYKEYEEDKDNETYTKKVNREYVVMMIEEAEELLLITPKKEKNEVTYRLNHQILKQKTKTLTKHRRTIQ